MALADLVEQIDERRGEQDVSLVLSVTEKRGIIPQDKVFRKRIAIADTSKYKVLRPLDIAYNPYLLWTGAIGQWLGGESGVTSPVYETFRTKAGHDSRFVGLILTGGSLTDYFDATAIGSIQRRRRTPVPVFLAARISVPAVDEQQRIVAVMAAVDAQIEALEAERRSISEATTAVVADLVQGFERTNLGDVLLDIEAGRSPQAVGTPPSLAQRGVLKVSAVKTQRFMPGESKTLADDTEMLPDWEVRGGDLLITRANTPSLIGQVCRVPNNVRRGLYLCDKTLRLVPDTTRADADYLEVVLSLPEVRDWLGGAATGTSASMLNLSQAKIREVPIPLIGIDLQRQIASQVNALKSLSENVEAERAALLLVRVDLLTALLAREISVDEAVDQFVEQAA